MSNAEHFRLRPALPEDEDELRQLIQRSARALSAGYYDDAVREAAIVHVFGVDSQLIADGTYFVIDGTAGLLACGGWSRRRTLFGGNQHKSDVDPLLDPAVDAARIRAFFVAPECARRGFGARLMATSAAAAYEAGFRQLELMATLPGVPLYAAYGFVAIEDVTEVVPNGVSIPFVRMRRALLAPHLSRA